MRRTHLGGKAMVGLLAVLVGCSSASHNLKPAASATKAAGLKNSAIASEHDVVVVVQTRAWPGNSSVTKAVTPLRVRVTNGNEQPVRVSYQALHLVAADGTRYAALPPVTPRPSTEPTAGRAAKTRPYAQNFTYSGFQIAPHLASAYPGIETYRGSFDYDPQYYDKYQSVWHG